MKIFVAGASGAIGRPLIAELVRSGHAVTGMTRSADAAAKMQELGAEGVVVDAFDAAMVERAVRESAAEAVIDELTALPADPTDMPKAAPGDRKLRLEGGGNLYRAAVACGVRRYLQQSTGFFFEPGEGLADESAGLAVNASPSVALAAQTYASLEERLFGSPEIEGVALRYGFFYGPGTWYQRGAAAAEQMKRKEMPLIGAGQGVWSWVHIEDAAAATVAALAAEPGIYNIVDSDPSPTSVWLPKFAAFVGAPAPENISEEVALQTAGEDAVYYQTRLRGASNAKAKKLFGFAPRRLEWL
jgi:nucleoside-diphosphate-sugar epimerase